MTDKQPEAPRSLYEITGRITDHNTVLVSLAELETLTLYKSLADEYGLSIFKDLKDLGDAGSDVQLLRMGYAAARLEIESLNAQLHAAKQINAAQFGLLAASIPGSAMRASHEQAQAQPAPRQEAQEPVAVPRFNCWSTNEGDSWFDHPADPQAIYDCLGNNAKVGDEYELTAGWESVTARYRITGVVGDGEEYEVECISHPQENTAPPPSTTAQGDALDAERLDWLTFNLSGKALRDIGVVWSEHGDARRAIDAARAAQEGK